MMLVTICPPHCPCTREPKFDEQERRLYTFYSDTDKARIAAEREAKAWRGIADALALVLKKNGVGGRQWQSAMDLYDEAVGNQEAKE